MENTIKPPSKPFAEPDPDNSLHSLHHQLIIHGLTSEENKTEEFTKSCFSDEAHSGDETPSSNSNNKSKEHKKIDILNLADQEDPLKVSRITLINKLATCKDMNAVIDELPPIKERSDTTASMESDMPNLVYASSAPNESYMEASLTMQTMSSSAVIERSSSDHHVKFKPKMETSKSQGIVGLPILQGYIKKKSPSFLHLWQVRYLILKNKKLLYYKDNNTTEKPLGCLDFDLISVKLEVDQKDERRFMIVPIGSDRTFSFKADSVDEGKMWAEAIKIHIDVSDGIKCRLNNIVGKKNFWKNDRISEAKFLEEAKTGDLLLFRTHTLVAILQRSVTRSQYDHVGVVLKVDNGDVVLFEALGGDGVGLCRWSAFKNYGWHNIYEKVVHRKLHVERTKELIDKAEKFVKGALGRKYSVTPKKLLQRKSTTVESEVPKDRTYFCSELVAACYKKMGLLPYDISSAQYLPGTFAAEKKLPLLRGAKLGEEYLIDFNLH